MTWSAGLSVTADGSGVVAHAGSVAVRLLADRVGLTGGLSTALARRSFRPGHDRGRVLVDLAVLLADGGEAIADIDVLRHQDQVRGGGVGSYGVASPGRADPGRSRRVEKARAGPPARGSLSPQAEVDSRRQGRRGGLGATVSWTSTRPW